MYQNQPLLRDILDRTRKVKYLTVRPEGFILPDGSFHKSLSVRVLAYGQARTLYRGRKPHCRSLDAIQSIKGQPCDQCHERKHCTPQVRLDLLVTDEPVRLLLAYSSARNFLLHAEGRPAAELEKHLTQMTVINRHTWGELQFSQAT